MAKKKSKGQNEEEEKEKKRVRPRMRKLPEIALPFRELDENTNIPNIRTVELTLSREHQRKLYALTQGCESAGVRYHRTGPGVDERVPVHRKQHSIYALLDAISFEG